MINGSIVGGFYVIVVQCTLPSFHALAPVCFSKLKYPFADACRHMTGTNVCLLAAHLMGLLFFQSVWEAVHQHFKTFSKTWIFEYIWPAIKEAASIINTAKSELSLCVCSLGFKLNKTTHCNYILYNFCNGPEMDSFGSTGLSKHTDKEFLNLSPN